MTILLLGLVIFFAVHSISLVSRPWRDRMAARAGAVPWMILYSLVSILGLVLIVRGYIIASADPLVLYKPTRGLQEAAMLLMLPVFPLVFAAYLPGRIRTTTKHPMLLAVILWSAAHLLSNGTLADVLLFGVFLIWAIAVRISLARRSQRPMISAPVSKANDVIAVVLGLALHAAFLFSLHEWLIGAPLLSR
jgi:uncharacterized membrane protein